MPKIVVEPADGEKSEVPVKEMMTLGRRRKCDVVITDSAVSRHHATIELVDGSYVLRDEGSSNGTLLNGEPISEQKLRDGDKVTIGETVMTFRTEEPAPAPAPEPAPAAAPAPAPRRKSAAAPTTKPPSRRRSGRRQREDSDPDAAKAEAARTENTIKLVVIGACGLAALLLVILLVKVAFPSRGGGGRQRVIHRDGEASIRSLQNAGRKALSDKDYRTALENYEACYEKCESLRSQPKYQGDGFYWLEQTMQECLTKIRECREQVFRQDMRRKRGIN